MTEAEIWSKEKTKLYIMQLYYNAAQKDLKKDILKNLDKALDVENKPENRAGLLRARQIIKRSTQL